MYEQPVVVSAAYRKREESSSNEWMNAEKRRRRQDVVTHSIFSLCKRLCVRFFPLSSQSRNPSITIKFSSLRVAFSPSFFLLSVFRLILFFAGACLVCCVPKPLFNAGRSFQTRILIISVRPTYLSHLGRILCKANSVKYVH